MITITKIDASTYQVEIAGKTSTSHRVTVPTEYALKITAGKISVETLVEKSFEFLLAREPNTSILRSFELSVIGQYFPEYESAIRSSFSAGS